MSKKRLVLSLGHKDLGTNLPEQKAAVAETAPIIADFVEEGWQVAVTHSNAPQVGMIHGALSEFAARHEGYTPSPLSVCSAMSQGYIGYDLQNGLRSELLSRGIYKCVSTIMTEVTVDPYDEAFYQPLKTIGRFMTKERPRPRRPRATTRLKSPARAISVSSRRRIRSQLLKSMRSRRSSTQTRWSSAAAAAVSRCSNRARCSAAPVPSSRRI